MLYNPDTQKENRPSHNDLSEFISKLSKKEKQEKKKYIYVEQSNMEN